MSLIRMVGMSIENVHLVLRILSFFYLQCVVESTKKLNLYLVVKYLQFLVFIIRSFINGNGWACGIIILFRFLKSIHSLHFFPSSLLQASVTGAAKGLQDSSINPFSRSFPTCSSISFLSSIVHLYGLLLQYLSTIRSILAS